MTKKKLTEIYTKIFTKMGDDLEYNDDGLLCDSFMIIGNANITFGDVADMCEAIGLDNIEIEDYDEIYIKRIDLCSLKRCNFHSPDELDLIPGKGLRLWWD